METATDIKALDYTALNVVLENIESREPLNRFGWITYGHATTNKLKRSLKRMKE